MGTFYNLWATNEELMETLSDKKRLSLKEQNKINLCYSTTLSNHNKTAPLNPVAFFVSLICISLPPLSSVLLPVIQKSIAEHHVEGCVCVCVY